MTLKILITAVLFLCGIFHSLTAEEKTPDATSGIVIENGGLFNFGTYSANLEKKHTFTLINIGNDDLVLGKIRSTCECSALEPGKKILKPGEKTTLSGIIKAESVSGPYSKNIYIETNRPTAKLIKLTLQGNAVPLFTVEPSHFVYMGALKTGEKKTFQFKIRFNDKGAVLALPEIPENAEYSIEMERHETFYMLSVTLAPRKESDFFSVELLIAITAPLKWKPLIIKLNGKAIK